MLAQEPAALRAGVQSAAFPAGGGSATLCRMPEDHKPATMPEETTRPAREGVEEHEEVTGTPRVWAREIFNRRFLAYLGPGFLVSVGYMDPGNWGTDLEGGARFGYDLLWVLLVSNLMAIFLQALSAKLGLVTEHSLSENCRLHFSRGWNLFLWFTAEIAMIATDMAEFVGAALGFYLLLRIPMPLAALLTAGVVLLILLPYRHGARSLEYLIMGLVSILGLAYVVEIALVHPQWRQVAYHVVVPKVNSQSIVVAVGMLGATVMPHNLFLHSAAVLHRERPGDRGHTARLIRYATADAFFALNLAWLVNSAILITAAAAFYAQGMTITSITQAYRTLEPLLGPIAATAFAVGLLASGLSSSTTGTLAGQVVMEGFLHRRVRPLYLRLATMTPALVVILLGFNQIQVLVLSQVVLSLQLPFAIIPLLLFTRDPTLMGKHANRPVTNLVAWTVTVVIILLNGLLLAKVLGAAY